MANVPREGEVLKHRQTGELFEIRKISCEFVILHSRDGISQIMTGGKSLFQVFEKVPEMKGPVSPFPDYDGPEISPEQGAMECA